MLFFYGNLFQKHPAPLSRYCYLRFALNFPNVFNAEEIKLVCIISSSINSINPICLNLFFNKPQPLRQPSFKALTGFHNILQLSVFVVIKALKHYAQNELLWYLILNFIPHIIKLNTFIPSSISSIFIAYLLYLLIHKKWD